MSRVTDNPRSSGDAAVNLCKWCFLGLFPGEHDYHGPCKQIMVTLQRTFPVPDRLTAVEYRNQDDRR